MYYLGIFVLILFIFFFRFQEFQKNKIVDFSFYLFGFIFNIRL